MGTLKKEVMSEQIAGSFILACWVVSILGFFFTLFAMVSCTIRLSNLIEGWIVVVGIEGWISEIFTILESSVDVFIGSFLFMFVGGFAVRGQARAQMLFDTHVVN